MAKQTFRLWRGAAGQGNFQDYTTEVSEGMVVLDAVHQIQAKDAPDLACRWNCKAGKCGSCSAEINGKPKLMCMTRLNTLPADQPVTVEPMRAFPHMKDLVGIVRQESEMREAITRLDGLKARAAKAGITGNREYNNGWHTAIDLHNLMTVSEAIARCAVERKESRGAHFREDFPNKSEEFSTFNHVIQKGANGEMTLSRVTIPAMPAELQAVIEENK